MVILDAVANVAPYAFVLPYIWIAIAYLVAIVRVRHTQPHQQIRSIVAQALFAALFWPVWLILMSNSARNMNEPGWMLIWYVFFIIYPLLAVSKLKPTSKSIQLWQKIGFASLDDFLLLRPLPETQPISTLPEAASSKRWVSRSIIWLMFGVSLFATGLSFVGNSLQPCQWLDLATGRSGCLKTITYAEGSVNEIALSSDAQVVAIAGWFEPLRFYDMADGSLEREMPAQKADCGRSVSFSPDDRLVATVSKEGAVMVWDVQTKGLIHAWSANAETLGLKFSPDGKYLAVSVRHSGLQFWRTTDWTLHRVIPVTVYSFSFSADGQWLAADTDKDRIGIWDMTNGTVFRTIDAHTYQATLSPDGRQLATTTYDDQINIWDVSTGRVLRTIGTHARGELLYSNDGQYLLASESYAPVMSYVHQISVWRTADGQQVAAFPANNLVDCVAFASKSNVFGYGSWKSLKVFRLRQY